MAFRTESCQVKYDILKEVGARTRKSRGIGRNQKIGVEVENFPSFLFSTANLQNKKVLGVYKP